MIRRTLLLVAAMAVVLPAASSPAMAKDKAEDAAKVDPDKKVCRYEGETGSMMRKRVCHTTAEWKQLEAANSSNAREMINRNNANRPALGGT